MLTSTTREHVDRELVKADLLAVLNDTQVKGKTRDLVSRKRVALTAGRVSTTM